MDNYCKKFVEDIFLKHDKDRSNVLERKELKNWVRDELKSHKFFNKQMVTKEYEEFFAKVDTNNDGKSIDGSLLPQEHHPRMIINTIRYHQSTHNALHYYPIFKKFVKVKLNIHIVFDDFMSLTTTLNLIKS
jgi:hypothetical protein